MMIRDGLFFPEVEALIILKILLIKVQTLRTKVVSNSKQPIMKTRAIFILISCFFTWGCEDNYVSQNIYGTWEWVKTTGGLIGELTPENSGYSEIIEINQQGIKVFQNGALMETKTYQILEDGSDCILINLNNSADQRRIHFESTEPDQISISYYMAENTVCNDCPTSYYIKVGDVNEK
jgi:hypothetical protein